MGIKGLRQHVAEAIRRHDEQGGLGLLKAGEYEALEVGVRAIAKERLGHHERSQEAEELKEHMLALCGLKADLGPHPLFIHGETQRVEAYWLKCADIAIAAYDEWIEQRTKAQPV